MNGNVLRVTLKKHQRSFVTYALCDIIKSMGCFATDSSCQSDVTSQSVRPNLFCHNKHFKFARRAPDTQRKTFTFLFRPHLVDNVHFNCHSCLSASREHHRYSNSRSVPAICHTQRLSSAIKRWVVLSYAPCPPKHWNEPDTPAGVHKHRVHILWRRWMAETAWAQSGHLHPLLPTSINIMAQLRTLKKRKKEKCCRQCMSQPFGLCSQTVAYVTAGKINITRRFRCFPALWFAFVFN